MNEKEMIEAAANTQGLTIESWDPDHENGLTAVFAGRWVATRDDEGEYIYAGDEGVLSACVVGSEKFRNQRVSFSFTADGYDEGNEVTDLTILDPVD